MTALRPWLLPALISLTLCIGGGVLLLLESPRGLLLYTPPPNSTPHYTPSFMVGFLAIAAVLVCLFSCVALIAFLVLRRKVANSAFRVAVVSALLFCSGFLPEQWWALTSHSTGSAQKAAQSG
jgi:hypothetical protein